MLDVVCDLSHHNNEPDFGAAAASGVMAVFYKATQGLQDSDPTFAAAEHRARAVGMYWGAYHFGTGDDGAAQASHFLAHIPDPDTTLMVLDFEPNLHGPSMTLTQAHDFVLHVRDRTGRWPGFYSGCSVKEALGDRPDAILAQCWFWLAQYGPIAEVPRCWPTWTFLAIFRWRDQPAAGTCPRLWPLRPQPVQRRSRPIGAAMATLIERLRGRSDCRHRMGRNPMTRRSHFRRSVPIGGSCRRHWPSSCLRSSRSD